MMGWGYGITGAWFGMLIPLVLIVAIVYAVIRLSEHNRVNYGKGYDNSLDILNERFARGEIGEEEYMQKKALIMQR